MNHLVICGKPGSGKTTYAESIREQSDIVFDLDKLSETLCPATATYHQRPDWLASMLIEWRHVLVRKLIASRADNRCILIITDETSAERVADLIGGEVVKRVAGEWD